MQRWRRLGHVHVAAGEAPSMASHASYPTALSLPDGRVRVFFSPRDSTGRSSISSLDLDLREDGARPLGPPRGPWLEPGARGAFDDSGASVACVRPRADGGLDCWYLGWTLGVTVPFRCAIGLARAAPGEARFTRLSAAPTIDRSAEDPFTLGYPWVLPRGGEEWAWYGTHLRWGPEGLDMLHALRRAVRGPDGSWRRDASPCLEPLGGAEYALSRPCVLPEGTGFLMWYCTRHPRYRLGVARSPNGVQWHREDATLGFIGTVGDWEEGEQAYPCVFDHGGRRWMLYNGRGYGRTGFGLAVLEG